MIYVRYSEIPSYLQNSVFYRTLSSEEADSEIQIPSQCFKLDDSIINTADLSHMLLVERFWGLDELPWTVMNFYYHLEDRKWKCQELDEYPALFDMWQVFTARKPLHEAMTNCHRPELVLFLIDVSSSVDSFATHTAAGLGRVDYLASLCEHGYQWNEGTCSAAAKNGQINCLMFAHENGCPWNEYTLINAAANGHLHCIVYAIENGLEWHKDVCTKAAEFGHLNCLRYAVDNGLHWEAIVTLEAAVNGHVECLRFALEKGCPIHKYTFARAADSGHLECLVLLHQYNAPWDASVTKNAASSGHLQCLRFLHENGCPWDASTSEAAAWLGYDECLRYAIDHGCDYGDDILKKALSSRSLACLIYLVRDLGLYMAVDGSVFVEALQCGTFSCLQYLVDAGCPMGELSLEDALHGFAFDNTLGVTIRMESRDSQLCQCLEYAMRLGWCWNEAVIGFVREHREELPLCWTFINDNESIKESCSM